MLSLRRDALPHLVSLSRRPASFGRQNEEEESLREGYQSNPPVPGLKIHLPLPGAESGLTTKRAEQMAPTLITIGLTNPAFKT